MTSQTIIGQIDKILFQSDSFFIAALKSGEKISGTYVQSEISHLQDCAITLHGEWFEHKKYGKTFRFEQIKVNQNELFFFLTKIVKGFGSSLASELIEKFGNSGLIEILDNDINRLLEFKGIKTKRLGKIEASWKKFRSMRSLGELLTPFGVSATLLNNIATAMKEVDDAAHKIAKNPYILTSIRGVGFKTADDLALKMGVPKDDENRIAAAMDFALMRLCEQQGNSAIKQESLFSALDELICQNSQLYELALLERISEEKIVPMQDDTISPIRLYNAEKYLFADFQRRAKIQNRPLVANLEQFLDEHSLTLGDEQKEAVKLINDGAAILFLVGYAGTGKSTTAKAILDLLNTKYDKKEIITCALSGIASQRIADTTGYESATIQSLLVKSEDRDSFVYSVVLIDEASMINSTLFAQIVSKVPKDAILIIVGDDAQLPPIGAGDILSDSLTLSLAPIVKLTKIYRQEGDKAIKLIANDVRLGVVPNYKAEFEDFEFISTNEIVEEVIKLAVASLQKARYRLSNKQIKEYINYFQLITPLKGGPLGSQNLNKILQECFNPNPKLFIRRAEQEFRLMDKVVHTKNENMTSWSKDGFKDGEESSQRRVFNGMSGLLFKIDKNDEQLFVFYPNEDIVVVYDFEEAFSLLMLSYALTVHKVQGMEYDMVVMPMSFAHFGMHNTKLLYTAITRAKHRCTIIGDTRAFESCCKKIDITKRDTVLKLLKNQ